MTTTVAAEAAGAHAPPQAPGKTGAGRLLDALRWLAVAVVVAFAVHQLSGQWGEFVAAIQRIPWHAVLLAELAVIGSILATAWGWQTVVDALGRPVGFRTGARIYLVGHLGKYVPGSVWGYLLQMELGRKAGVARARIFVASLVHLAVILVTAMLAGLVALPVIFDTSPNARWMLAFLPLGLVALHPRVLSWGTSLALRLLRRPGLAHPVTGATVGRVLAASAVAKVLQGLHLWLLADAVGAPGWAGLVLCVGAMALAMTAGTVAFIFPAGVGAREVVIIAVLVASGVPAVPAAAVAVVSRVLFVLADLVTAGSAASAVRSGWRLPSAGGKEDRASGTKFSRP